MKVPVTFYSPAFIGPQIVNAEVTDRGGGSSGYQLMGSWTTYAASSQLPSALPPTPSAGTGTSQLFFFHANDVNGSGYIPEIWTIFNSSLNTVNACYFAYDRAAGWIGLANDAATSFGTGGTLGSSTVLSSNNSQCSINLAQSSASGSGNDLYLTLAITFTSTFTGTKNVYEQVYDHTAQNTGWVPVGTWNVSTSPPPDFYLTAAPTSQTVTPGSSAQSTFMLTPINGFSGGVSFSTPSFNVPGLSFSPNPATGQTTMTVPAQNSSGTYNVTVVGQAIGGSPSHSVTVQLSYSGGSLPSVTCSASPNPVLTGQSTTFMAFASGGTSPYTYAWSGAVTGSGQAVPFQSSNASSNTASVLLTDNVGHTASNSCSVTVQAAPMITVSPLPGGYVSESYSQTLTAAGGTPPYSWSVTSGSLPPGVTLAATTGALSGTPTANAVYNFAITVTDTASLSSSQSFSWTIGNVMVYTDLASFGTCISSTPQDPSVTKCELAPNPSDPNGRYPVNSTLTIGRSDIAIYGSGGPGATVLVRANSTLPYIMQDSGVVSRVTISDLTFDGNRYGFGIQGSAISCLAFGPEKNPAPYTSINYIDLNLSQGGNFTVQWLDFFNAPGWALELSGHPAVIRYERLSSVSASNFGQGSGYGIYPVYDPTARTWSTAMGPEPAKPSAGRWAAIYLPGSNNGAQYNAIAYAGNGAIDIAGAKQYFRGNLLQRNRFEMSDGGAGGQVYLDPVMSSGASVTGNVINGDSWSTTPSTQLDTSCQAPQNGNQFPAGVEVYGFGHAFFNNEIEQHTGTGIQLAGSNPTGRITISSQNPSDPTDTPRYIEMNGAGGIVFLGQYSPAYPVSAQGATLYNVNVRSNAGFDVDLDGVSDDETIGFYNAPYHGFLNGSCRIPGTPDGVRYFGPLAGQPGVNGGLPPPYNNSLSVPAPNFPNVSYGSYTYNGGTCPDPGWPAQTPARSRIPGWPW